MTISPMPDPKLMLNRSATALLTSTAQVLNEPEWCLDLCMSRSTTGGSGAAGTAP